MSTPLGAEHADFTQWKHSVEQRLRLALARASSRPRLEISQGDFEVRNNGAVRIFGTGGLHLISPDGTNVFNVYGTGGIFETPEGNPQPIVQMRRDDDTLAFQIADPSPLIDGYNQFWAWYDRAGNIILGDDTTSGKGLAKPYMAWSQSNPGDTQGTALGTYQEVATIAGHNQNPKLGVAVSAVTAAGVTGDIRVIHTDSGAVMAGPTAIPAGGSIAPFYVFNIPVASVMWGWDYYTLQQRKTNAVAGNISCRLYGVAGLQS